MLCYMRDGDFSMNSSKAFDDVILYLEKIISDGCEIDYCEIAKIATGPAALFQRI